MMALKALMIRKKLDIKRKELEEARAKEAEFQTREAELETAIAEATTEEEQEAVNEEIEAFTADRAAHNDAIGALEKEISELEADLASEERSQNTEPVKPEVREDKKMVTAEKRNRFGLSEEMIQRDDVQNFIGTIRTCVSEKRAISGAGLLIPDVFIGLIKENVVNYSKLYRHVFVRRIGGEGKLTVMGTIPEAIWTACCANINEIDLGFADVTIDCNRVAAFIPVCNAVLEDSDIDLAADLIEALTISIGKALDKAILYGSGSGMPLGIYTRLAQTSQPAGYPATARPWVDLHTSNMLTIANTVTGVDLFKTIMLDSGAAKGKYARGEKVWVMNETTYTFLKGQGMSVNAAGQIVSAVDGRMPAVGGIVEVLDFVPDYNIIGGYFDLYLLGERAAITVESADRTRFIEDETLFRAKARYDGQPVIAEAFINLAINSASASAPTFTADAANSVAFILLDKSALTVAVSATAKIKARLLNANGQEVTGAITWASGTAAKATVDGGVVTGVATGNSVITATAGDAVAVCNVTVVSA